MNDRERYQKARAEARRYKNKYLKLKYKIYEAIEDIKMIEPWNTEEKAMKAAILSIIGDKNV